LARVGHASADYYTATSITFDDPKVIRQSFELPPAQPMEMTALGETLPVYGGSFQGRGSLLLKFPMDVGKTVLSGQLRFQQCSDTMCEAPETIPFEVPLTIEVSMDAERKNSALRPLDTRIELIRLVVRIPAP